MIAITSSLPLAPKSDDRQALAQAATRFEAIFARQMLSSARQAGFGDSLFSSQANGTFRQMLDERFADILADSGSLGLGKVIEAQLARQMGMDKEA
ncbi:MAG: rod-binding protein [Novosphingobium sp.]